MEAQKSTRRTSESEGLMYDQDGRTQYISYTGVVNVVKVLLIQDNLTLTHNSTALLNKVVFISFFFLAQPYLKHKINLQD